MRLLQIIVVLFGISFITFGLTYMSPGDPVRNMYSANGVMPTEEMVEQTREEMGLNDPFFVQYGRWLGNCLQKERNVSSQIVSPPIIISLNLEEQEKMKKYQNIFKTLGFEIESFGGREYSIRAVPQNLFGMTEQGFFIEVLDHLEEDPSSKTLDVLSDRMATMACKAAVKGNQKLSLRETEALIDELLQLENPYNCPHGRPTIISMTKYELEKKFKRIV